MLWLAVSFLPLGFLCVRDPRDTEFRSKESSSLSLRKTGGGVLINHKLTPNKCLCFLRNFKRSIKTDVPPRTKPMSSPPPRHQGGLITSCALEGGELCTIIRTIYIAGQGNHRRHHRQHPYVLQAADSRYPDTTSLQRSLRVARGHWSVPRASVA